jgi:mannose-1-phosphate guanylyltransferase
MAANARASVKAPEFTQAAGDRPAKHVPVRYGIVLAGGEGARMRPLISHWLGEDRPKQYCTFTGSRSMFQHTMARACSVVPGEHIVTVIGRGHREFLTDSENENMPGLVLEQPNNLGTAPGVFWALTYVLAVNPEATVILLPSDHYAHPEDRFCDHIVSACELAEKCRDRVILVGAVPDRAETDYGWIAPGKTWTDGHGPQAHGPSQVAYFQEKPEDKEARALYQQGCLWNTMVMAAKAQTLWNLGRQYLHEMLCQFDAYLMVLRAIRAGRLTPKFEADALAILYDHLATADFSRDILQHVSDQSILLPMDGVDWSDWGHPQRVTESLARLGRRPSFPADCVEDLMVSATWAKNAITEDI